MLAGGRMYGKVGPWTLGLLDVQTGSGDRANDLVVRVKHDLLVRWYVGAIGVQRIAAGAADPNASWGSTPTRLWSSAG